MFQTIPPTMVSADKDFRKRFIMGLTLAAFFGLLGAAYFSVYFQELRSLVETNPKKALIMLPSVVRKMLIVHGVFSSVFAFYFFQLSARIFRAESYPPPGMKVIKDTKVRTGKRARYIAWGHLAFAVFLLSTNICFLYLNAILMRMSEK